MHRLGMAESVTPATMARRSLSKSGTASRGLTRAGNQSDEAGLDPPADPERACRRHDGLFAKAARCRDLAVPAPQPSESSIVVVRLSVSLSSVCVDWFVVVRLSVSFSSVCVFVVRRC